MGIHFWVGQTDCPTAFVFSTPGRHERNGHRPVAGTTGTNMDGVLVFLHEVAPDVFPSVSRYDYRITNASTRVLYAAQDNGRTEDYSRNILDGENLVRLLTELEGCRNIVLCGDKAGLLADELRKNKQFSIITGCHLSNQRLHRLFPNDHMELSACDSPSSRRRRRFELCAQALADQLAIATNTASGASPQSQVPDSKESCSIVKMAKY